MANIKAFKPLLYNTDKAGPLCDVIAPPYDNIPQDKEAALYANNSYNIIRLLRPAVEDGEDRYAHANALLERWMQEGILAQSETEGIYVYEQSFEHNRHRYTHRGLIALVALEPLEGGNIRPHEECGEEPAEDRYRLLAETEASFSQIYCLFTDEEKIVHAKMKAISKTTPTTELVADGISQKLWLITEAETIALFQTALADKKLFIADGHHRYKASLRYREEMRARFPDAGTEASFNYTPMLLTDIDDSGILTFPTHRLLKKIDMDESMTVSFLKDDFLIDKIIVERRASDIAEAITYDHESTYDSKIFALYFGGDYYYRLRPKDTGELKALLPDRSAAYRDVDVAILNTLILDKYFKIRNEDMENPDIIGYTLDTTEALEAVQNGEYQCCVVLKPTKVHQIRDVALAGEKMPPRSTFFVPKPFSGLVMYKREN